jgi:hypothetical protein
MQHPATVPRLGGGTMEEENREPARQSGSLVPLAESRGVVRDVLAAVGNLQHLLRSPRVGAKALAQVIPGLRGLSDSLLSSIEQVLEHARRAASVSIEPAATQLHTYSTTACERLRIALDRVGRHPMDAKTRLSFEADIVKCDAELNSARQLLDLLIHSTEHSETDLFIEEVVRVAFSNGSRSVSGTNLIRLTASYARDGSGFRASAQVIVPLLVIAAGWVRTSSGGPLFLSATCREDEPVVVTISYDGPQDGEQLAFEPPLVVAPTLACAETAARLTHASFEAEADRVVIWFPRTLGA